MHLILRYNFFPVDLIGKLSRDGQRYFLMCGWGRVISMPSKQIAGAILVPERRRRVLIEIAAAEHIMMKRVTSRSVALASLTATYTDSEEDDDIVDEDYDEALSNNFRVTTTTTTSTTSITLLVPQVQPAPPVVNPVARLVSYNDDTLISDEEDEQRRKSIGNETGEDTEDDIRLPPEPKKSCSSELQEKIVRLHKKMSESGLNMNHVIQQRKDFRNPSIYEKLIQFCNINELGTNYPADRYDPVKWGKESFYEELAKAQKVEMDRREKERKERTKVEFVSGIVKKPATSGSEDDSRKRKSKWDQVGNSANSSGNSNSQNHQNLKPAGLVQPLTMNATGTKGTVISAFGSLQPKRPRV